MDTDDESPLFYSGANAPKNVSYSDSEDDTLLSSTLDHDGFEGLNVSDKIKNIMSIGNFYMDNTFDDENEALFEMPESLKNRETTTSVPENKFMNFPFNKPESSPPAPEKKKRAGTKKPKEKKRKRDRGKKKEIQHDVMEKTANKERTAAFLKELAAAMDSTDDEEESERLYKAKPRKARKTRKQKSLPQVDENGEQLMRTAEFLGDTSSSEEEERRMTKRDELEMQRESDRRRREANLSIKPTFNKKSFNDFVNRLANKKNQKEHKPSPQPSSSNSSNNKKPITKQDSDDDLEIIGAPISLLSPDRTKPTAMQWSPVSTSNSVHKKHNKMMRDRIAQYMYARRREMEEAAMARGEYRSAADRAKLLLQREREAELIDLEVKRHFSKNRNSDQDDSDGDYEEGEEGEGYNDDIMDELSGQEEEDDDNDDEEDDAKSNTLKSTSKNNNQKGDNDDGDDDDDEDDMATVAFKRWKRKAGKKSIFDDDDDDEIEKSKPVVAKKPEPKHSIANFFKNNEKTTVVAVTSNVTEDKPLSRLKQKGESEQEEEEEQEVEKIGENESMDIDKELDTSEQHDVFIATPKKPQKPKIKSAFVEEEAEEEEDEFFGAGGAEAEETEDLDQFEEDGVLVERNEETDNIDEAELRQRYNADQAEKDKHLEDRLVKDITSGGLRRRMAAMENGVMLDDFEFYDNEDDDLIAIRRAAAAKRRRMLLERGDLMEQLASDPKTAAFAKAAQTVLDEESRVYLSDSEEEAETETKYKSSTALVIEESEEEEDNDEEDEEEEASSSVPIVVVEKRMEVINDEDGLDFESDIQIQTMARSNASPLTSRDKPFFRSPGKMDRFKSLLAEGRISFGGSNDTGTHVGFGAPSKKDKGKEPVRGFVPTKNDKKPTKSRLLGIMASRADSFT